MAKENDEEDEEREELIDEIHETSDELEGYIDDLIMEVDMAVEEAEDNNTSIERLREIKDAKERKIKANNKFSKNRKP